MGLCYLVQKAASLSFCPRNISWVIILKPFWPPQFLKKAHSQTKLSNSTQSFQKKKYGIFRKPIPQEGGRGLVGWGCIPVRLLLDPPYYRHKHLSLYHPKNEKEKKIKPMKQRNSIRVQVLNKKKINKNSKVRFAWIVSLSLPSSCASTISPRSIVSGVIGSCGLDETPKIETICLNFKPADLVLWKDSLGISGRMIAREKQCRLCAFV